MSERLNISINQHVLYMEGAGPMLPGGIRQFFTQIPGTARNAGLNKILVDGRLAEGSLTTLQRFEYGNMLAEHFRGLQVAIVVSEALMAPDLFGETVAVNRGANIRMFQDMEDARCWLGIQPVGPTGTDNS